MDLGIEETIKSSGTWPVKEVSMEDSIQNPPFQLFDNNWLPAEGDEEILERLIQQEIQDGFVTEFGSLEQAKFHFGKNLAIGKLGIAKQQPDKPRLV